MKLSYVFIGNEADDIKIMYDGFNKIENGEFAYINNSEPTFLERCLFSHKNIFSNLNKKIFNSVNNNKKLKYIEKNFKLKRSYETKICFIVYARVYEFFGCAITNFLRKNYAGCICVCYFGDLVDSFNLNLKNLRADFDYIFSFDEEECKKYNFLFLQEPFSYIEHKNNDVNKFDVTFVGAAKNRLAEILNIYELFKSHNLKLDFNIVNVEKKKQQYTDEIIYNKRLSFVDVLNHVLESKCILEVMQKNAYSPSSRFAEAVLYKKYLITNCKVFDLPKEDIPENVIYFENPEDIDLKKISVPLNFDNKKYIDMLSIETMIKSIENHILCQNHE